MSTSTETTMQPTSWGLLSGAAGGGAPAAHPSDSGTSTTSFGSGNGGAAPAKADPSTVAETAVPAVAAAAVGTAAGGSAAATATSTPQWQAPLYASAGGNTFIPGDAVDLNEIFSDDFLLPGMGMMPYGDYGSFSGNPSEMGDLLGGPSNTVSRASSVSGDAPAAGAGNGGNVALAMMTGGSGGKGAAAVVAQAAARTRSGITTRLGGARLQAVQAAAEAMRAAAAQGKPPAGKPPQTSSVGGRAAALGRGAQAKRGGRGGVEEEEEEEDDESEEEYDSEDEDGAGGGGNGLRRRKKAKLTLKPLTEQQRVERRERNREHAKRSRMRKKFMLESLQAQMQALRKENLRLRQLVATKIPERAESILRGCSSVKSQAMLSTVELGHHRALADSDGKLISALQFAQQNFTVSDPSLPDNPIVYASQGFLDLTGYTADQIIGRNCRFLQGPGTDPAAVDIIRRGVALGEDTSVCLLNYRADGTPFWNQFFVAALRDSDGNIVNYVGVQCEVAEAPIEEELKERVKTINFDEA